jgi:subtilisin family serine protease
LRNLGQIVGGQAGTADADIDAPEGWQLGLNLSSSVRVAVIDTGATTHPDFLQNIFVNPGESGGGKETNHVDDDHNGFVDDVAGWDFVNNDNVPIDDNSHGSHVSGTIAGRSNNAAGVAGVASFPRAPANGGSEDRADQGAERGGQRKLHPDRRRHQLCRQDRRQGCQHEPRRNGTSAFLDDAIRHNPKSCSWSRAGNDGVNDDTNPHTPCVPAGATDLPNKICVAATDNQDNLASFSNFGVKNVDLAAPAWRS